ncbi:MAG: hypothetical protein ABIJ21_06085 [Nanoarchaeota archaeon]
MKRLIACAVGGLISLAGITGALYSRVNWRAIDKRADIIDARTLEKELLAESLLIERDGRYKIVDPDTANTTYEEYVDRLCMIQSYEGAIGKPEVLFGLLESDMYKAREHIYYAISFIGLGICAIPFLKRKNS